jgi:hypothetical protein
LRWLWWCGGGYRGVWAAAAKASGSCSAKEMNGERGRLTWLWCDGGGGCGDGGGDGWCCGKRGLGVVIAAVEVVVV